MATCHGIDVSLKAVTVHPTTDPRYLYRVVLFVEVPDLFPRSPGSGRRRTRDVRLRLASRLELAIRNWLAAEGLSQPASITVHIRGYFSWKPWEWARPVTIYWSAA